MALPLSRNRSYSNGSPVIPGDLNDLQDQIIALNAALTETRIRGGGSAYGIGLAVGTTGGVDLDATGDVAFYDVDAPVGRKLTGIRARVLDNVTGSTKVTVELFSKPDVSLVTTGFSALSLGNGTAQTLSIVVPDLLLAAGTNYVLRATISAANICSVRRVEFDWRR